jgi:hypothetical protein
VTESRGNPGARHEDRFTVAGFDVQVYGDLHAVVHPDIPVVANSGFLVEREIAPDRAYSIHDAYVSEIGMGVVDSFLALERERAGTGIRVFKAGETVELPA